MTPAARTALGLSQAAYARAIGVAQPHLCRVERQQQAVSDWMALVDELVTAAIDSAGADAVREALVPGLSRADLVRGLVRLDG